METRIIKAQKIIGVALEAERDLREILGIIERDGVDFDGCSRQYVDEKLSMLLRTIHNLRQNMFSVKFNHNLVNEYAHRNYPKEL